MLEAAAIPNEFLRLGSPLLGLFCMVPLYAALYGARTYRRSFLILAVQALTVHLASSFWLAQFHGYAAFTLGASAAGTMVLGGLCGIVMHLLPSLHGKELRFQEDGGRRPLSLPARILWFPACIVLWEWVKSTGFLGYPWGTLPMAAYRWKVITQVADVTGTWGVTFLYALFAAVAAEGMMLLPRLRRAEGRRALTAAWLQSARFLAVAAGLCAAYGLCQYFLPRRPEKLLNAVIVQQNIDPWEGGDARSIAISKRLTEGQVALMREEGFVPDLVLWSEGVLGERAFPMARRHYEEFPPEESLTAFIRRMDTPFIIGGTTMTDPYRRHFENSAILFDRTGGYAGFYSKTHLVPFAEQVPFAESPLMQAIMDRVVMGAGMLSPGSQYVLFRLPLSSRRALPTPLGHGQPSRATIALDADGRADPALQERYTVNHAENPDAFAAVTVPICFEDAFPDVCRKLHALGSEAFLNITNDSWSHTPSAEYQHFVTASYRAIEYRTTLVRCANSGYSAVVDPTGRIVDDLPLFTERAMGCRVPLYAHRVTTYARFGDWFAYLLFAGMALYLLYVTAERLRRGRERPRLPVTITIQTHGAGTQAREEPAPAAETATIMTKAKKMSEKPLAQGTPPVVQSAAGSAAPKRRGRPKKQEATAPEKGAGALAEDAQPPKPRARRKKNVQETSEVQP